MALLKAPLASSKEIHSSCGCMSQISLAAALATAESSPSDVCALESMTIILFSCVRDKKTMLSVHRKANRGNRFHGWSLFSAPFVRQEDWVINASAMCSCSCGPAGKYFCKIFNIRNGMLVHPDDIKRRSM